MRPEIACNNMSVTTHAALAAARADLTAEEASLADTLLSIGQGHLFDGWPPAGLAVADKRRFLAQLGGLDGTYPGGLAAYVRNARRLLAKSRAGTNPLEGWLPRVPAADLETQLRPLDDTYCQYERIGLAEATGLCFVIPAGGLGERLGFSGIKMALPAEICTGMPVLQVGRSHRATAHALSIVPARH
jgi:UDP-sugar pyrophosphorylase